MHWLRWLVAPLLALSCLSSSPAAADPEIWFAPHGLSDWLNLWTDEADWQQAAQRTDVIQVVSWWLQAATDQQILALFDFAKSHHKKIEMETSVVESLPTESCGNGEEGYTQLPVIQAQLAVLQRLNLHIDILTMDEPVWFGHYDTEPSACRLPMAEVVSRVVADISSFLAFYPDLQIVEIEPVPPLTQNSDWRDSENTFHVGLAQQTGRHVVAFQLDIDHSNPAWKQTLKDMRVYTRENNMKLGFYIYGGAYDTSSQQWIDDAVRYMETAEGELGVIPEQAIFASWSPYPTNAMPEASSNTMTWLINRYAGRQHPVMVAHFVGRGLQGTLTTAHGLPIANATINGYVPGINLSQPLPVQVATGVVPAAAVYGLIGYRLNIECLCSGYNDVLIGALQYQETAGGTASYSYEWPFTPQVYKGVLVQGQLVGGVMVNRVIATPSQYFPPNSAFFPVTAGAQYTFTVPAGTVGGEGWYGHAFVDWFDKNYNGLAGTVTVVPNAGRQLVSTATTAADGSFLLVPLPRTGPGSVPVSAEFAGDNTYRGVTWTPLH
jgi:hypothetical protein